MQGRAFALATAARPITRATADRLIKDLLDRINTVNTDPNYLYKVKKVVVFGAYLTDRQHLSGIDIGLYLDPKVTDVALYQQKAQDAMDSGREFKSNVAAVTWAHDEVVMFLKHRSRGLQLMLYFPGCILDQIVTKTIFAEPTIADTIKQMPDFNKAYAMATDIAVSESRNAEGVIFTFTDKSELYFGKTERIVVVEKEKPGMAGLVEAIMRLE